jgi:hypothetical protein
MYRADNVRFVSFPDGVGPLWEAEGFSLSSRWLFVFQKQMLKHTESPWFQVGGDVRFGLHLLLDFTISCWS